MFGVRYLSAVGGNPQGVATLLPNVNSAPRGAALLLDPRLAQADGRADRWDA